MIYRPRAEWRGGLARPRGGSALQAGGTASAQPWCGGEARAQDWDERGQPGDGTPGGWGGPSPDSSPGPLGRILALEELRVETDPGFGVGQPPQIFAQRVGASEASRHRPSRPGNQALTHDPLRAPTLALLRVLCRRARRGGRECPRAPIAGAACPWAGDPFHLLPMGGGGPHPCRGRSSEALMCRSPAKAEPPPPLGSRSYQSLSRHSLLLAAVLGCPCPGAGRRVCRGGPTSAGPAECENRVLRDCPWTQPGDPGGGGAHPPPVAGHPPSQVTLGEALGLSELDHKAGEAFAPVSSPEVQSPLGPATWGAHSVVQPWETYGSAHLHVTEKEAKPW